MKRLLKAILAALAAALVSIVAVWLIVLINDGVGRPILWEFPPGYRGWVVVHYEDPSCPPLRSQGIFLVITIAPSGRGCTASALPRGWRYHRYEYVYPDGSRITIPSYGMEDPEIWAGSTDARGKEKTFFVGTKEELNRSWGAQPRPNR